MGLRFENKVAIITAAASGIGRATAEIIGREGGVVIAVDREVASLEAVCQAIRAEGGRAHAHSANVLDPTAVEGLVAAVVRDFGRVDILINGVGGSTAVARPAATIDELTLDDWRSLIAFNLEGTFLLCHHVAPIMKQQRAGKIVNVGSIASRGLVARASVAYAAAKGAIVSLTLKLAHELGPHGVNVNAIAPGVTLTDRIKERWAQRSESEREQEVSQIPLRRFAEPVDQARVICFLASQDADFLTGVVIDVTGGL